MLRNHNRVSKPSNIAHVHQQRWNFFLLHHKSLCQFLTEQIFIANLDGYVLAIPDKRFGLKRSSNKVGDAKIDHLVKPLKVLWNKFSKWHQMLFVVEVFFSVGFHCDG